MQVHLFVIHAKSLTNRLKNVERFVDQMKQIGSRVGAEFNVTLVGMHDTVDGADVNAEEPLHPQHVSCALKHRQALRDIVQMKQSDGIYVIVEDDVHIENADSLYSILNQFETEKWDAVFFAPVNADAIVPRPATYVLPTCHAYIIRHHVAEVLEKGASPIRFRWNIHLTLGLTNLKKCGLAASIVDGSKHGQFLSTQSTTNVLFHPKFSALVQAIRENKDVEKAYKDCFPDIIHDHPHVNAVYASYLSSKLRHREAHVILQHGMDVAVKHPNVILNNKSEFMQQFLQSFVHVQE